MLQHQHLAALLADRGGGLFRAGRFPVGQHEIGAVPGQHGGDAGADAPAGAGHDGDFSFQIHEFFLLVSGIVRQMRPVHPRVFSF